MQVDIRKLMAPSAQPTQGEETFAFAGWDFYGFAVDGPVTMRWKASPSHGDAKLWFALDAVLKADCARCLEPAAQPLHIEKDYAITRADFAEEVPQLPLSPAGMLDLEELAYGEIVIEAPTAILCREDCEGLCPVCGKPAGQCGCDDQAEPQPEGDPRLAVLKTLLTDEDD